MGFSLYLAARLRGTLWFGPLESRGDTMCTPSNLRPARNERHVRAAHKLQVQRVKHHRPYVRLGIVGDELQFLLPLYAVCSCVFRYSPQSRHTMPFLDRAFCGP